MRLWIITLLLLGFSHSLVAIADSATSKTGPLSIAVLGDTPYSSQGVEPFISIIEDINRHKEIAWVMHAGDIKSGGDSCSDELLEQRADFFGDFKAPFILTPGDNDWTDCHRKSNGSFKPLNRLEKLRELFFSEPILSNLNKTMNITSQRSSKIFSNYRENLMWSRDETLFATLHIVGSANGWAQFRGRTLDDDHEAKARLQAAIAWLQKAFAKASDLNAANIVLMWHADMGFDYRPGHLRRIVYEPFLGEFNQLAAAWNKPILVIHGDTHVFRFDQPFTDDKGQRLDYIWRLETFGDNDLDWVLLEISDNSMRPFNATPVIRDLQRPRKR